MSIKVVDFGSFGLGKPEPSAIEMEGLSTEMIRAFSDIGFVYLKNTWIEEEKVTEVMYISKKFFVLPSDIKHQYTRSMNSEVTNFGWIAVKTESLNPTRPADLKEAFNVSTLSSLVVHRVLLPQSDDKICRPRQSLAFFVHPDNDVTVTCFDGSQQYPPTNPLQYLMERFDSTYKM
ncbi:uncharacterized protein LOC144499272 [Mustelus asterias]